MATSYPVTLPTTAIRKVVFRQRAAVARHVSPFTGQQQVFAHPFQGWEIEVELAARSRADAEASLAALLSLNGGYGTFYLGDPLFTTPRGVATGTPVIDGPSQTGNTLNTDGWTISQTGIVKAGDWLQIGTGSTRQLVKVTADSNSDAGGNAALEIWPRIRTAFADGTSIVTSSPKGVWRLREPVSWEITPDALIQGITFAADEAF